jgi:hypothetical protein
VQDTPQLHLHDLGVFPMRVLAAAMAFALATPVSAQTEVDADILADVVGAIAANGCQITEDEADPILDPLGHAQSDIRDAADRLVELGAAAFEGDTLVMTEPACTAAQTAPAPGDADGQYARMVQLFQDNGCAYGSDAMEEAFALLGLSEDDTADLIPRLQQMVLDGQLVFDRETDVATLSADLCVGGVATVSPRDILLSVFADNGCVQPLSRLMATARAYGLETSQVEVSMDLMIDAGEIDRSNYEAVMLRSDLCEASPITLVDPVLANIAALADENCQIITTGLLSRLEDSGVPREDVLLHDLRLTGLLTRRAARQEGLIITLPDELCAEVAEGADPAAPQAGDISMDLVLDLFRANGCSMTQDGMEGALAGMGYTREESEVLRAPFAAMIAAGDVILSDDEQTATLSDDVCQVNRAETPFDPRAVVTAALADNGCRLTEDQGAAVLPDYGLSIDDSEPVVEAMIADGVAIFSGGELVLAPSVCRAAMGP